MKLRLALLAALVAFSATTFAPALADGDDPVYGPHNVPQYVRWQDARERYEFDRHHVILGTVTGFAPYRLQVARRDGNVQTIDLKNGTVILPTGTTPMRNELVAVVGYYSRGTFIANRVLIHP